MTVLASFLLALVVFAALIAVVVVPTTFVIMRKRRPELERLRSAPFTYGTPQPPTQGSTFSRLITVAGQPATISVVDPRVPTGRPRPARTARSRSNSRSARSGPCSQ